MKNLIFALYDKKAHAYTTPFYLQTKEMAVREFSNMANNKDTQVGLNPEDWNLFYMGEYDQQKGMFELVEPYSLGNALEYKTQMEMFNEKKISDQKDMIKELEDEINKKDARLYDIKKAITEKETELREAHSSKDTTIFELDEQIALKQEELEEIEAKIENSKLSKVAKLFS